MNKIFQSGIRRINQYRVIEPLRKELRGKYPELFSIFSEYINTFHKDGGFSFQMQDIKVLQLFDMLMRKKPESCVEYGTGSTSLAFAFYAKTQNKKYLGLDESPKWSVVNRERIEQFIGKDENYTIKQSNRIDKHSDAEYLTSLEYTPSSHYDFMLTDGPSFSLDKNHTNKINDDILKYGSVGLPETIIVDNRRPTVDWMIPKLKSSHNVLMCSRWYLRTKIMSKDKFEYYAVFEKTS